MLREMNTVAQPVVHVRYAGRSFDVALPALGVSTSGSDEQLKAALSRHLEVPRPALNEYVVDRHTNGNLTIRPEAVFG